MNACIHLHTFLAVWPSPALHALHIAEVITCVMAKVIISGATLFVALVAIVISVAAHTHAVLDAGCLALVLNDPLLLSGVHFSTINTPLDQQIITCCRDKNIDLYACVCVCVNYEARPIFLLQWNTHTCLRLLGSQ